MINLSFMKSSQFIDGIVKIALSKKRPKRMTQKNSPLDFERRRKIGEIQESAGKVSLMATKGVLSGGGARSALRGGGKTLISNIITHIR